MNSLLTVLLVTILAVAMQCQMALDYPCFDDSWSYSNKSGKCYKNILGSVGYNWTDAQKKCSIAFPGPANITLSQFKSKNELEALVDLFNIKSMRSPVWIGATRIRKRKLSSFILEAGTSIYRWQGEDRNISNLNELFNWSGGSGSGDCLVFVYDYLAPSHSWSSRFTINEKDCAMDQVFFCEHYGLFDFPPVQLAFQFHNVKSEMD
ncbi:hypothetical protein Ciccas_010462 [Cichlidogyrus casuarinus]|uniref:C-type lectin domain-containing protein n=1 Tax=Cichlidogyrus casuarinus TaxID=1844966 RepID=A0ABD2PW25_9PLAT